MGPWNHGGWRSGERAADAGGGSGHVRRIPARRRGALVRVLAQGQGHAHGAGGLPVRRRREAVALVRRLAARRTARAAKPLPPCRRQGSRSTRPQPASAPYDQYVSDPAHPVPYRPRPVEQTYDSRGSRWRTWETEDQRFVDGRPDVVSWVSAPLTEDLLDRRRRDRAARGVHHRPRRRLGREADRRLPRQHARQLAAGRLPAHGGARDHARPLPEELLRARAAPAEHAARLHGGPAPAGLHLQEGPPHHGAGPEHLVPAVRPQSADLGAQHLPGEGVGLPGPDAPHLAHAGTPVARSR